MSWILPKNECWGNFQYIKLHQCSVFFEIYWPLCSTEPIGAYLSLPYLVANVLHLSIGGQYGIYGDRIPAVFINQLSSSEQVMEFRSSVSGNHDHGFDFSYQLNTPYHIDISQLKNNDIVTYSIWIDNVQVHSTVNTDVEVFPAVKLYLSSPWLSTFGIYGTVRNLWVGSGEFASKLFTYFILTESFLKFYNSSQYYIA